MSNTLEIPEAEDLASKFSFLSGIPTESSTKSTTKTPIIEEDEGPSLMEEMQAAANEALSEEKKKKDAAQKEADKSFGASFGKKLRAKTKTKNNKSTEVAKESKKKSKKCDKCGIAALKLKVCTKCRSVRYCSRDCQVADWKEHKKVCGKPKKDDMPFIKKTNKSSLVFDDVQKAVEETIPEMSKKLADKSWMTPDFLDRVSQDEEITAGLKDPECMDVLNQMQKNPEATMKKYRNNSKITSFIMKFMKLMGEQFSELGEKEAIDQAEPDVQKILKNPELKALIADPSTREMMYKAGDPKELNKMMHDPITRRKLMILREAGLLKWG